MPPPDFPQPENNLGLPVKYLVKRTPVFIEPVATVAEAARTMREALIGSVLVADDPPGIVTDRDLCSRVLAAGLGPETPVRQVMTRPLKTLDSDAPVFKAMHLMLEEHIHHLALVEEGKIVALISSTDLLRHEATSAFYLRRTLDSVEDLTAISLTTHVRLPAQYRHSSAVASVQSRSARSSPASTMRWSNGWWTWPNEILVQRRPNSPGLSLAPRDG